MKRTSAEVPSSSEDGKRPRNTKTKDAKMDLGEGFKGKAECPIWLLECAEAMVIPLGKNKQTNPVYSGKPGQANSSMITPNCRTKHKAMNFATGQIKNLTFLAAEIFLPNLNKYGWINLWQGTKGGAEGTMYCEAEHMETQNKQCHCGACQANWAKKGWTCPAHEKVSSSGLDKTWKKQQRS